MDLQAIEKKGCHIQTVTHSANSADFAFRKAEKKQPCNVTEKEKPLVVREPREGGRESATVIKLMK